MRITLPQPNYQLIGHRGTAGLRPENTFCSFKHAAQLNLNWIEFDVRLTKDEHWIVLHDDSLQRTTNGRGLVHDCTLAEIQTLDAGLWFKPPYAYERIPTLLATLELAQILNLFCNIEIKGAEANLEQYVTLFTDFANQNPQLVNAHTALVSSFSLDCLLHLKSKLPNLPLGYLINQFTPDTIEIALQNDFASINCDVTQVRVADVTAAASAGIPVFLYTVNDANTAKFWLDHGVSALFTDRPDLLR